MGRQHVQGHAPPLISPEMYAQAQAVLHGVQQTEVRKHEIAFRGMLTCAHDKCPVTGEIKKGQVRVLPLHPREGACELPRFREQEIAEKLGHVLEDVNIPREVAEHIELTLEREHVHAGAHAHKNVHVSSVP